ncbi:MAG TPA: hypothetical protein VKA34_10345 [Balneolales bacterium]|nr:hypothetical protein [Balneolales bacterium]
METTETKWGPKAKCSLIFDLVETDERTYANIDGILPPQHIDKGKDRYRSIMPPVNYVHVIHRPNDKSAEEYSR